LISDGVFEILHWLYFTGRTNALESTQTLKEMSTKVAPGRQRRPMLKSNNITTFFFDIVEILCIWSSRSPIELSSPV